MSDNNKRAVPFPNRSIKRASIPQNRDATRDRRRNLFLKKVQKDREEGRWELRSEQVQTIVLCGVLSTDANKILKSDYVSQRRQWEAEQARRAPDYYDPIEEDEDNDPMVTSEAEQQLPQQTISSVHEDTDADAELEWAARQDDELYDYISECMQEPQRQAESPKDSRPEHFGSDDDDYDSLLLEAFDSCEAPQLSRQSESLPNDTLPRDNINDTDMMDE